MVKEDQMAPMHFHWNKMEDIIIPPLNKEAAEIVHKNWQAVDEVPYQLGKVEKMVEKYAAICGTPDFEGKIKSAMLLMCGDHGIAKYGVSAYPQEVTMQMINGYMRLYARHCRCQRNGAPRRCGCVCC